MPALPDVPGVLKVALSGTLFKGNEWLSRYYLSYTGTAPTVTQLGTFNAALITSFGTNLKSLMNNENSLTQVESIDLTSPTSAVATTSASVAGTRGTAILPAQIATVVSYEIARRYRGGHPRGYWPFGVETDLGQEQAWTPTYIGLVNTGWTAFLASNTTTPWSGAGTVAQCNVSYYKGFTVITNPVTGRARNVPTLRVSPVVDAVTAFVTRASPGTQRRRQAFVD